MEHLCIFGNKNENAKSNNFFLLHNWVKKWIDNWFWSVSTKYFQKKMI